MQIRACAYDSIGLCHFADGTDKSVEWLAKLLGAFLGDKLTTDSVMELGKKILETEKNFNLAAGISEVEDRLPEFMLQEPLSPTNSSFTVSAEEIEKAFSSIKGFKKM
jgi:aldehyde:ferredoxin oxidoreductase